MENDVLNLLKPIILDGTEKIGDSVYCLIRGECTINNISDGIYSLETKHNIYGILTYTKEGLIREKNQYPTLYKTDPFKWLANNKNNSI